VTNKAWWLGTLLVLGLGHEARAATFARMLAPLDGATVASPASFRWTAAEGASAYMLWVGTAPGGSDLLTTGESLALSHPAVALPEGVPLFARIWTRTGSTWRYADARFAVPARQPAVLYNGQTGDFRVQLEVGLDTSASGGAWTAGDRVLVADFSGDGLADLFRYNPISGEWQRRINLGNGAFRVSGDRWGVGWEPVAADLDGDGRADVFLYNPTTGAWASCFSLVNDAFAYFEGLWAPGWSIHVADFNGDRRQDLFLYNARPATDPNSGRWFKVLSTGRGAFQYIDGSPRWAPSWRVVAGDFNGDRRSDLFLYDAQLGRWFVCLEAGQGFTYLGGTWDPNWQVQAGDFNGDGRTDLFLYRPDLGRWTQAITTTPGSFLYYQGLWGPGWTLTTGSLDADTRTDLLLYDRGSGRWARVLSRTAGTFSYEYGNWEPGFTTVALGGAAPLSRPTAVPLNPAARLTAPGEAFRWTAPPLARAYRLQIGSQAGAANLHDSGRIQVTRRFVTGLPQGVTLYGRLLTETAAGWAPFDFPFVVGPGVSAPSIDMQIAAAMELTADVRAMASAANQPHGWTPLFDYTTGAGYWGASCPDYAVVLTQLLAQARVTLSNRMFNVAFNLNLYDMHTLVEMLDTRTNQWLLLDPTFGLTVRRTSDSAFATSRDVSQAARLKRWSDLEFVPLGPDGLSHADNYYIDYPLLFLNVFGGSGVTSQTVSVLPYLEPVSLPIGVGGLYVLQSPVTPRPVVIDGLSRYVTFVGVDGVTWVFWAGTVDAPAPSGPALAAYRPRRYVF
jgi:FG-GAP-like repeat